MPISYTGKGDKGISSVGKKKISKTDPALAALGDLDELNSFLGLARAQSVSTDIKNTLRELQEDLFIVQAEVAAAVFGSGPNNSPSVRKEKVSKLEKHLEVLEGKYPLARKFVVPGASLGSAWLDVARTVARRAERSVVSASRKYKFQPAMMAYLNRLSSILFMLARVASLGKRKSEEHPTYK